MVQLLIIADDFTGALDTGVQFSAAGVPTKVTSKTDYDFERASDFDGVLVVDSETRHLSAEDAGNLVFELVRRAVQSGVTRIYKKTDSALRGNIGIELQMVLEASRAKRIHFIPAFPKMGRITRDGIQYIDGTPVAESVFGNDPFEPVFDSEVGAILGRQAGCGIWNMKSLPPGGPLPEGICIYDAVTEQDMEQIAEFLEARGETAFCAGCAGFAALLPDLMRLRREVQNRPEKDERLIIACGSMNPITAAQLDRVERKGMPYIRLEGAAKYDREWSRKSEALPVLKAWAREIENCPMSVIDTNPESSGQVVSAEDETLVSTRKEVAQSLGHILKWLLDYGIRGTVLVTGGDCLIAFLNILGIHLLQPICEPAPGVVLSKIDYNGRRIQLISKSGGFGNVTLFEHLYETLIQDT